jgi:hypothetical protein
MFIRNSHPVISVASSAAGRGRLFICGSLYTGEFAKRSGIEKLVDQVFLIADVPRQQMLYEYI